MPAATGLFLRKRRAFTVAPSFTVKTFVEAATEPPNRSVSVASSVPSPDTVTSEEPPPSPTRKRGLCPSGATHVSFVPPATWNTAVPALPA